MRAWRSVITGALALLVLQTVLANREGAGRISGLIGDLAGVATRIVDPTVPALGPIKTTASSTAAASSSTPASSSPVATGAPTVTTVSDTALPSPKTIPLSVSRKVAS